MSRAHPLENRIPPLLLRSSSFYSSSGDVRAWQAFSSFILEKVGQDIVRGIVNVAALIVSLVALRIANPRAVTQQSAVSLAALCGIRNLRCEIILIIISVRIRIFGSARIEQPVWRVQYF